MSGARRDGLAYGVGALHAAARGDRMMWALHRAALSNGIVPVIPAVAVAEGYRTEARGDRIGELLNGAQLDRGDRPVVFKSVGIAVEDIAAAKLVYEKLTA